MRILLFILFPLFCLGQTITLSDSDVKAFYTAEGWGKNTTGGRGGTVIHVTNLNASGAGSLQEALLTNSTRIIVFDVGGTIDMNGTDLFTQYDNVTIAGETAPGGGIAIRNGEFNINSSNVIVRHLRFRGENTSGADALKIRGATETNIIVDHCSASFGVDENLSITDASNVTIQYCLLGDELGSGNILFQETVFNTTLYRNLSVWNGARNPRSSTSGCDFEMINNVFYGYSGGAGNISYENETDWIGNVFNNDTGGGTTEVFLTAGNTAGADISLTRIYISDNLDDGVAATFSSAFNPYIEGSPIDPSGITASAASGIIGILTTTVGAGRGVQGLDSYDSGLINDVVLEVSSNYRSTPTFPTLASGTQYADADGDGLSDEFETVNGGNISPSTRPATATLVDGTIIDQSGVTNYVTTGYTYMDIFLGELAGDWVAGSPASGGGNSTPDGVKNGTSAMLIAH